MASSPVYKLPSKGKGSTLFALIPAAGNGSRMGLTSNKVFLPLSSDSDSLRQPAPHPLQVTPEPSQTVLAQTIRSIIWAGICSGVVLVIRPEDQTETAKLLDEFRKEFSDVEFLAVSGGPSRQRSVFCGLQALESRGVDWVLVHDGARPFCPPDLIRRVSEAAMTFGAAILALPSRQSIKQSKGGKEIDSSLQRAEIWEAQTPQVFSFTQLLAAHERAAADGVEGTDDSELVEREGIKVRLVPGDDKNLKITTPFDLVVAKALLNESGFEGLKWSANSGNDVRKSDGEVTA